MEAAVWKINPSGAEGSGILQNNTMADEAVAIVMDHVTYQWWVNIGSGNGMVPSGTKLGPETMLTQIFITVWHH